MLINVEPLDSYLRIVAGVALLAVAFFVSGNWRWIGLIGLLPLASGIAGWCPLYAWLMRD
jgi:DUF2892 family protein